MLNPDDLLPVFWTALSWKIPVMKEGHCIRRVEPGRSGTNNRLFLEAVSWIARTGSAWRDLLVHIGNWSTAFRRFRDWRAADVFKRIFDAARTSQTWNMRWSIGDR